MHDEETKRKAFEWADTSPKVRLPNTKQKFCDGIGISTPTFDTWIKERKNGKGDHLDAVIDQLADLTDEDMARFRRQVYKRAMEANASAKHMELNAKLEGMLVEKTEIRVKLSDDADELARLDAEADRRTKAFREQDGTPSLQEEPPILLGEIREDTGQDKGSNPS